LIKKNIPTFSNYLDRLNEHFFHGCQALSSFFVFVSTRKDDALHGMSPAEEWFGLKAYTLSTSPAVRILGWIAVGSLSLAVFLIVCLTVSRCVALWDLWFEAIRRPDQESPVQRFIRIFSFWLFVVGLAAWLLCKIFS